MENPDYKKENIDRKYLNKTQENQFLKIKYSLLELEEDFIKLKDRELNNREIKIKREIEELFFKPIIVSIDDMDQFEEKETKKIRPIKNTWYDWLIDYIPEPITKIVSGFKDNVVSLFNTNAARLNKRRERKETNQTKQKQKQYEENKINSIEKKKKAREKKI